MSYEKDRAQLEERLVAVLKNPAEKRTWIEFFRFVRQVGSIDVGAHTFEQLLDKHLPFVIIDPNYDDQPAVEDFMEVWKREHPEEVEKYTGKMVAWHPVHGIVDYANNLEDLIDKLRQTRKYPEGELALIHMEKS